MDFSVCGKPLALGVVILLGCSAAPAGTDRPVPAVASAPAAPDPSTVPAVSNSKPPGSARIGLTVRETAGVARAGEVASTGIPMPRALAVRDPRGLAVVDPAGKLVPAEFRVLARWNAGLADAAAPIQWVLVSFPATVPAKGSAVYTLVTDGAAGANPPPPHPLQVSRSGAQVVIDTGAAVFRLGGAPGALFEEVRVGDRRLISGGTTALTTGPAAGTRGDNDEDKEDKKTAAADAKVEARTGAPATARRIWIEHAGPLTASIVVDAAYDLPQVGRGGFGSERRYAFTAGSATALVRQVATWEGNLACQGCLVTKAGQPNGVLVTKLRDTLTLDREALGAAPALDVTAVGAFKGAALEGRVTAGAAPETTGDLARVRQALRRQRTDPLAFEAEVAGKKAAGQRADGGVLAAGGPGGTVAVALNHMHRYEPQALRLLADGRLAVDLADDQVWLPHNGGLFAGFAVAALPGRPARAELDRQVWAPLNHPLRAWPSAAWFAGSQAAGEIPAGKLPRDLAAYDDLIPAVLDKTIERIDAEGTAGLMTFGVFPRYWGRWNFSEIDCKHDPTPGTTWDNAFWCGSWTDYHDTLSTVPIWVMRTGDVQWLDELAFPGALRTLHTQIMQCAPDQRWFYCGQAPSGYGAYREDFNSSHAYFDNLFLYYWLTGDGMVVDTLRRGGENMRRFMCDSRGHQPVTEVHGPDGPACTASVPPQHTSFTGRVAGQWLAVFRFLGLASEDASFLEDFRTGLARELTHQYAEVERDGKRYGFLGDKDVRAAGEHYAGPLWMNAFYDAEELYRYEIDSGDAPLGDPPLRPSAVLTALARTLAELVPRLDGKHAGLHDPWPQSVHYTWDGGRPEGRLGGRLATVTADGRDLYGPEKAGMAALLVRAGQDSGDRELLRAGEDMVHFVLQAARDEQVPLGKLEGQYLTRLHAAVARLAQPPSRPIDRPVAR